jgi:hypothetical protein
MMSKMLKLMGAATAVRPHGKPAANVALIITLLVVLIPLCVSLHVVYWVACFGGPTKTRPKLILRRKWEMK